MGLYEDWKKQQTAEKTGGLYDRWKAAQAQPTVDFDKEYSALQTKMQRLNDEVRTHAQGAGISVRSSAAEESYQKKMAAQYEKLRKQGEALIAEAEKSRGLYGNNAVDIEGTNYSLQQLQEQLNAVREQKAEAEKEYAPADPRYAAVAKKWGELENEYAAKKADYDKAVYLKKIRQEEAVQKNEDYAALSKKIDQSETDSRYNWVNNQDKKDGWEKVGLALGATEKDKRVIYMTAEQRGIYNYLYQKGGLAEANKYYDLLYDALGEQKSAFVLGKMEDFAEKSSVGSSVASIGMNLFSGAGYIDNVLHVLTGQKIDVNSDANMISRSVQQIRNTVSEEYASRWMGGAKVDGGSVGSFLYNTMMSVADCAASVLLCSALYGGVAAGGSAAAGSVSKSAIKAALAKSQNGVLAILGTNAAESATLEALENGSSDKEALLLGTLSGAAEIITEKVSIEALLADPKTTLGYLAKNLVSEGSEEVGSDILNLASEVIIRGDQNQVTQDYKKYKAMGYSDAEALGRAWETQVKNAGADFLGGALSGLVMSGGTVVEQKAGQAIGNTVSNIKEKAAKKKISKNLEESGAIDLIRAAAPDAKEGTSFDVMSEAYDGLSDDLKELMTSAMNYDLEENAKQIKKKGTADSIIAEAANSNSDALKKLAANVEGKDKNKVAAAIWAAQDLAKHKAAETEQNAARFEEDGGSWEEVGKKSGLSEKAIKTMQYHYDGYDDPVAYAELYTGIFNSARSGNTEAGAIRSGSIGGVTLPAEAAHAAYLSGVEQRESDLFKVRKLKLGAKVAENVRKGFLRFDTEMSNTAVGDENSARQRAGVAAASALSKLGFRITVFDSNVNDQKINGKYDPETDSIWVDVNAWNGVNGSQTDMLATLAHEITHSFKKNAPEQYEALRRFVLEKIENVRGEYALADLIAEQQRQYEEDFGKELTEEDAIDEVVANACEKMLADSKALETLHKENETLWEKIKEFVQKMIDAFKEAGQYVQNHTAESVYLNEFADELQELWDSAFAKSIDNMSAENAEIQSTEQSKTAGTEADGVKLSIRKIQGTENRYVQANRKVIQSEDSSVWESEIIHYVNEQVRKGNDIVIPTKDGDDIIITQRTAWKLGYRNGEKNGKPISDEYYKTKGTASGHIDELLEASKYGEHQAATKEHSNGFGKNGFDYRTAYFMDFDGSYYRMRISVGVNEKGKEAYNIGSIKRVPFPSVGSKAIRKNTLNTKIPQNDTGVKNNISKSGEKNSSKHDTTDTAHNEMAKNPEKYPESERSILSRALLTATREEMQEISKELRNGWFGSSLAYDAAEKKLGRLESDVETLAKYRSAAKELQRTKAELNQLHSKLSEIDNSEERKEIEEEIEKTEKELATWDQRLLKLESTRLLRAAAKQIANDRKDIRLDEYKLRQEYYKNRNIAEKWHKSLSEALLHPTKNKHVIDLLQKPVAQLLSSLDWVSDRASSMHANGKDIYNTDLRFLNRLADLRAFLEFRGEGDTSTDAGKLESAQWEALRSQMDIDENLIQELDQLTRDMKHDGYVKNKPASELAGRQMKLIADTLRQVSAMVNHINQSYSTNRRMDTIAKETISYVDGMKKKQETQSRNKMEAAARKTGRWGSNFLNYGILFPADYFAKFGKSGEDIFYGLAKGQAQLAINVNRIKEFTAKKWTGEEVKKWSQEMKTFTLQDGRVIPLSVAQIMEIRNLVKREQALGHIRGMGIQIEAVEGKTENGLIDVHLTAYDIAKICSELTDRQKAVAETMQRYLSKDMSDWGNAVTLKRWGYSAYKEEHYWPIRVASTELDAEAKNKSAQTGMYSLMNPGFSKSVLDEAANKIKIGNAFETFADHTSKMATYHALSLPVLDALHWYNYKDAQEITQQGNSKALKRISVQQSIQDAFGMRANKYFEEFIKDLNGANGGVYDDLSGLLGKMVSSVKSASVGGNIRVVVQQPLSMLRAANVIDMKYLMKGLAAPKGTKERMLRNSGIAQWKALGYFDTNIGTPMKRTILNAESKADIVKEKMMVLASQADSVAWTRMWRACELEQIDKGGIAGSPAFYEAVNRRFEEIVYRTQVVDSVLNKSPLLKSQNSLTKAATAFMSESLKDVAQFARAFSDARADKRLGRFDKKKTGKQIAKATFNFVLLSVLNAAVKGIVDAGRDDDDYETFWQKWYAHGMEDFADNLKIWNNLPLVKDISSIAEGFDSDRMEMQVFSEIVDTGKKLWSSIVEGKQLDGWKFGFSLAKVVSDLTGIPIYSAARDVKSFYNTVFSSLTGYKIRTKAETKKEKYQKLVKALSDGNMEEAQRLKKIMADSGVSQDEYNAGVVSAMKEDERVTEAAAARVSGENGRYEEVLRELSGIFGAEEAKKAVNSVYSAMTKEEEEEPVISDVLEGGEAYSYDKSDLDRYVDSSDSDGAAKVIEAIKAQEEEAGKTEKQVFSSLRGRYRSEYKKAYERGNDAECQRLRTVLSGLNIGFTDELFSDWEEQADADGQGATG